MVDDEVPNPTLMIQNGCSYHHPNRPKPFQAQVSNKKTSPNYMIILSKQDSFERWVQLIRVIGEYRQGLTDLCFYKLEPLTLDFFQNVILLLTIVGFLRGGCSRGGGNWGTLRIPKKDWGTLGNIGED